MKKALGLMSCLMGSVLCTSCGDMLARSMAPDMSGFADMMGPTVELADRLAPMGKALEEQGYGNDSENDEAAADESGEESAAEESEAKSEADIEPGSIRRYHRRL